MMMAPGLDAPESPLSVKVLLDTVTGGIVESPVLSPMAMARLVMLLKAFESIVRVVVGKAAEVIPTATGRRKLVTRLWLRVAAPLLTLKAASVMVVQVKSQAPLY